MLKKVLLLVVVLTLGLSTMSYAQMRMSPTERTKQLAEQLKLNQEQTKKVEDILTKSQDKISKLIQDGGMRSNREQVMKLRDESNSEIMKVLTEKQKTEFKKIMEEQRKRMEERRQNRGN